ncbi:MAG: hypothetical protein GY714_25480 [Desulfobacterales bacterium]|nr:hypothetical protein [Desulfobacterales bacterium]
MKKLLLIATVLMLSSLLLVGCGDSKPESDLPDWVDNPSLEGGISASGSAKIGAAGRNFAKTEASAQARDEIARQLGVKVKNMVKNFVQVSGVGDDQAVDKATSQVSKQVTSQLLNGSKITKVFVDKTAKPKELYVLVVLDPASIANAKAAMKAAVKTSFKNDRALWQQFQAKRADQDLDKEIEKEFKMK